MQPETRAVMELIHGGNFTLSVVLEGGSLLATYPYDRPKQHGNQQHNIFSHISTIAYSLCWEPLNSDIQLILYS